MTAMDWVDGAACQDEDPELFFPPTEEDLSWQDLARCAEVDPEVFFVEPGKRTRTARRICAGCEVRQRCADYAIPRPELLGVWGGLSERERKQLRNPDSEREAA